eukprot:gb/GECH01014630.1/.p1 GENE.gb/GECH01014630.1/~~gb/GECH01014630.1/.p1  ORF type:complete len:320 (+),score=83.39 gb/GECH01014630.1/:1-960(+)
MSGVQENDLSHGSFDWQEMEEQFKELQVSLTSPMFSTTSGLERSKEKDRLEEEILEILISCESEAERLLKDGNSENAFSASMRCLKLKKSYYGPRSLELVSVHFLLAKSAQYLKRFDQAQEFLAMANWAIIQNPNCGDDLRAELHQTYGVLYSAQDDTKKALHHLAKSSYYYSLMYGPEHIMSSFGYFNIGNVLASAGKLTQANDFHVRVVDIWYNHLHSCLIRKESVEPSDPEELGKEKGHDATKMLERILEIMEDRYGDQEITCGKAYLVMGLYYKWVGNDMLAKNSLDKAYEIHEFAIGAENVGTKEVETIINELT